MAPKNNPSFDVNNLAEKDFKGSALISSVPIGSTERARSQYPSPTPKSNPKRMPKPE